MQTAQGLVNLERFRAEVGDPQERGKEAFTQLGCVNCHGETGQGGRGGRLKGEKVRRELAEKHGGLNFPPQLVPQEVIDEMALWLDSGR